MKIRVTANRVNTRLNVAAKRLADGIRTPYKGSFKAVEWMANVLVPITAAAQCIGTGLPIILDFLVLALIFLALLMLLRGILMRLLRPICKPYFRTILNALFVYLSLYVYLTSAVNSRVGSMERTVYATAVVLIEVLFFRSLYITVRLKRRKILPVVALVLTTAANISLAVFLLGSGIKSDGISQYQALETSKYSESEEPVFANALAAGSLKVAVVDYGIETEDGLASTTIDLSSYLWDNTGIKKLTRESYLGYDSRNVPLRGRIWYPVEGEHCPVVFLVHGNHTMTTDSYVGYGYLGEHLASRGYVVVSVDENVCNFYLPEGLSGENAARAYLLLENMQMVRQYNNEGVLKDKLDYSNLALLGHSRGGEAVALAALYNSIGHNPEVGYQKYDYDFSIQSVIAVAPSVDQYQPSNRDVVLQDVNYLLVQGANDQDISTFMGAKQYYNVEFTGKKDCYKSYLYIANANHGQFNTTWEKDTIFPRSLLLNNADLLAGKDQRDLLCGYVTAFLDDTLLKKTENRPLFRSNNHKEEALPDTIYISNYQDSTFHSWADYEEDIDLDTATIPKGTCVESGLCFYKEMEETYSSLHSTLRTGNHVVYLWWNRLGTTYGVDFKNQPQKITKEQYLQFDVADVNEERLYGEITKLLDLDIVLTDSDGNKAKVTLSEVCNVYPPLLVRLYKLQFGVKSMDVKTQLQTVRIPVELFIKNNNVLDLERIASIQFEFDHMEEGRVLLDNIGIAKQ